VSGSACKLIANNSRREGLKVGEKEKKVSDLAIYQKNLGRSLYNHRSFITAFSANTQKRVLKN
jgi:hypothetical protein